MLAASVPSKARSYASPINKIVGASLSENTIAPGKFALLLSISHNAKL
jgi:hypothetical protein